MQIAHFSDSHITAPFSPGIIPGLFSKRIAGFLNLYLRRRYQLINAERNLLNVLRDIKARGVDYIVFSGDITAISLKHEFLRAREIIYNFIDKKKLFIIPGNHDQYTYLTSKNDLFHSFFTSKDDFISYPYPKIRIFEDQAIFVSINTSRFNPLFFDASGYADPAEIGLAQDFLNKNKKDMPVFLIIHHSLLAPGGIRDVFFHRLRNEKDILDFIGKNHIKYVLSGHIHKYYIISCKNPQFTQYNPGSTARGSNPGYFLYTLKKGHEIESEYISV